MNTHEYQAKEILKKYGIPIPPFWVASSLEQVEKILHENQLQQAVVKVQVHAGGRGKAGGVKLAYSPREIIEKAKALLGMKIVNEQTGTEGVVAHQILITPLIHYSKEYYMGVVIDRQKANAVLMVSPQGGMDIEEVAISFPDKIMKLPINLQGTFRQYQWIEMAKFMGWKGETAQKGISLSKALVKAFLETDASLLEINPLVMTDGGELWALDAKLSIDDNALFRQPEIAKGDDPTQLPKNEAEAKKHDLAYVALDGEIGCMVNGAGLAMATMDLIYHYGGRPANFLDVGGGASKEKIAEGFKILLLDPHVRAILINIFGGIMNCEILAAGIVAAVNEVGVRVPLVVRMEGTNVEKGYSLLKQSNLNIVIAESLTEAAETVVAAAKE